MVGLSAAQFQSGLPAGLDPTIWGENARINGGFPYLLALPPPQLTSQLHLSRLRLGRKNPRKN
jgi:hypothetical protein